MKTKNHIKIKISGPGSEICIGKLDKQLYSDYTKYLIENNSGYTDQLWPSFLESQGKNYWDFNDVANMIGISLDELTIEVFNQNDEALFVNNYFEIEDEIEDVYWRDYNINNSEKNGIYLGNTIKDKIVVFQTLENFSFEVNIPNVDSFELKKLSLYYSCTDEVGYGSDYGSFCNGLMYNETEYIQTDFGQNSGNFNVFFE